MTFTNTPTSSWEISEETLKESREHDERVIAYNKVIQRAYDKYDPPSIPKPERRNDERAEDYIDRLYAWGIENHKRTQQKREEIAPSLTRIRRMTAKKYDLKLIGKEYQ